MLTGSGGGRAGGPGPAVLPLLRQSLGPGARAPQPALGGRLGAVRAESAGGQRRRRSAGQVGVACGTGGVECGAGEVECGTGGVECETSGVERGRMGWCVERWTGIWDGWIGMCYITGWVEHGIGEDGCGADEVECVASGVEHGTGCEKDGMGGL